MNGKRKIAAVIKYIDFQRAITGNVTGDDYAGFYLSTVPGADDEPEFHIPRSILKKLEREGYLKFTDTTNIKEFGDMCVVQFLPKYKWVKFKYLGAIDWWKVSNPFWLFWQIILLGYQLIYWVFKIFFDLIIRNLLRIILGNT